LCTHFDHIVIGVGSMGSAACYYLAKRGRTVLGVEQFGTPHENGSHAGESRIIRKAYYEHSDYIPLLKRAYENWGEISQLSGKELFRRTGLIYAGPSGHPLIQNIRNSAAMYGIKLENDVSTKFLLPPGFDTLLEPEAGYVEPENTIRAYVDHARQLGATILENTTILDWRMEGDIVAVETNKEVFTCNKLVISAGAWSGKLIPGISESLHVTRQILLWVKPADPLPFTANNFPCWMIMDPSSPGVYYGFPIHPEHPGAIKLAYHYPGEPADPDNVNRQVTENDILQLKEFLVNYLPALCGADLEDIMVDSSKVCLYSNTPDEHFVIDNLPGAEEKVCMAWGFSGHGFKFVPAVGEILADLAMYHRTQLPVRFLNAGRFK